MVCVSPYFFDCFVYPGTIDYHCAFAVRWTDLLPGREHGSAKSGVPCILAFLFYRRCSGSMAHKSELPHTATNSNLPQPIA